MKKKKLLISILHKNQLARFWNTNKNPLLPETVPVLSWDEPNPDVPATDDEYLFEGDS